ncbi:MAG: molecular chaperone IbpA [Alteromonas macleodii]|jgi:molecular chaperone IbpA
MPNLGPASTASPVWGGKHYRFEKDKPMRTLNLAPLHRATVGFDQITDMVDRIMSNDANNQSYPPYNIEKKADDRWCISIAVAGFSESDLNVEVKENALHITANMAEDDSKKSQGRSYLHRGIATRAFSRRFHLADHVNVTGATHENGMLHIDLIREVPEALKPHRIEITKTKSKEANVIEAEKIN